MNRGFLSLAAAAIVATAMAIPPAGAAELTKLRVSTISSIDSAALEAARAKGYFATEGLDVDTAPMTGGAFGLPALAAGQVQLASSNTISTILGAQQGLGFQIVAAGVATKDAPPDLAGLIAKAGTTIKTGKDLEGKKVGVNTRNNIIWLYARAWVDATGGDSNKVTYQEVPFPQMVDAVQQGQVDAAFVVEPFLSTGVAAGGVTRIGWPYSEVQKRIPISHYASTKEYIAGHPDIIARFVRAYNRGSDWATENEGKPEWYELISSYTKIAPEKLKSLSPPAFIKTIDPAQIQQVAELMRKHGLLKGEFDPASVLNSTVRKP